MRTERSCSTTWAPAETKRCERVWRSWGSRPSLPTDRRGEGIAGLYAPFRSRLSMGCVYVTEARPNVTWPHRWANVASLLFSDRPSEPSTYPVVAKLHSQSHAHGEIDRKSTRLNSSHLGISYAVF